MGQAMWAVATVMATVACVLLAITMIVAAAIRYGRPRHSLHARRRTRRGRDAGWGEDMLEALLRMFRDDPAPPPATEMTVARSTDRVWTDPAMDGLPNDARPRVERINAMLEAIDRRIGQDVLGQPLVIEMEQMRDVHLPKLCRSYVEIPPHHRKEIFATTGRSASVHLGESLQALETRLAEIDRALSTETLSTFADNARFIRENYGRNDPLA